MKLFKRTFAAMLLACMFFVNLTNTTAVEVYATENGMKRVFSIDAGRKYFSENQLMQIIDKAYKNGYTDVQILLGNDALRFFLDDMSMNVNGKKFSSDDVKAALTAGNDHYYKDPNGNALTEAEMNRIVAYAKERGMKLIPVVNSPGHMDAILVGMEKLGLTDVRYSNEEKSSERTVNINNDEAIAFTKELVKKYVTYFGKTGVVEIFNFGADEYANDVFTSPGWGELQKLGLYEKFIAYANDMAGIIKNAGMTPMCFNDGIYYNSKDEYGTFDKDIIISYWTAGWWGFYVAKPEYFVEKGHKILNTNDSWYWVLGNISDGGYHYENALKNINGKKFNEVTGAQGEVPIIGSMQCVWADFPEKPHDMERIMTLMDVYSQKHSDYLVRPADFTKVDEAIAKVPSDLEIYTEESIEKLNKAINSVDRSIRVTEQELVDNIALSIENAISELKVKLADYSKVDEAINRAESLNKNDYKDYSKVEQAIKAVKRDLDITMQEEVDAMANAINEAIDKLEKKPVEDNTPIVKPSEGNNKPGNNVPQTSDNNMPMILLGVIAIVGLVCAVSFRKSKVVK